MQVPSTAPTARPRENHPPACAQCKGRPHPPQQEITSASRGHRRRAGHHLTGQGNAGINGGLGRPLHHHQHRPGFRREGNAVARPAQLSCRPPSARRWKCSCSTAGQIHPRRRRAPSSACAEGHPNLRGIGRGDQFVTVRVTVPGAHAHRAPAPFGESLGEEGRLQGEKKRRMKYYASGRDAHGQPLHFRKPS